MSYSIASYAIVILLGSLSLSGCQSQRTMTKSIVAEPIINEKSLTDTRGLKQCQQNLNTLSTLQTTSYLSMKKDFDKLMLGAAQYAGVRFQVNDQAQDIIDALYRYRVSYLCTEIHQTVITALVERAGVPK